MIYSNKQIKEAVDKGHIIVHPFNAKNIAGSSLDVTLGEWYFTPGAEDPDDIFNPNSGKSVKAFFGEPKKALKHSEWCKQNKKSPFKGISPDQQIIVIPPGERYICHTEEFVGILPPGTTKLHARSSWARNGLMVRLDAGWGDPGFIGRWGMPMLNTNKHQSLVIQIGERVAQIIFMETGEVNGEYATISGQYQKKDAKIQDLVKNWKPSDLLPKSYRENRTEKAPEPSKILPAANDAASLSDVLKEKAHAVQVSKETEKHATSQLAFMHSNLTSAKAQNYLHKDERENYLYYTPKTLDAKTAKLYEETTSKLFKNYAKAHLQLETYLKETKSSSTYIDDVQLLVSDLIPVSAYLHTNSDVSEVDQNKTNHELTKLVDKLAPQTISTNSEQVTTISANPKNELDLAQVFVFSQTDASLTDIEASSSEWSYSDRTDILKRTSKNEGASVLTHAHYRMQLSVPFTNLRDLKKQTNSLSLQELSPRNGYDISTIIEEADLVALFEETYEISFKLHSVMQSKGYFIEAQYACLNGHVQRALVDLTAHQALAISNNSVKNTIIESLKEIHPILFSNKGN